MKRSQGLDFDFTLPHEFSARRAREVALQKEKEKPQNDRKKTPLPSPPLTGGDKGEGVKKTSQSLPRARTKNDKKSNDGKKITEALHKVQTKEELAAIIIDELTSLFERAALLLVTRSHVVGWRGEGSPEFSHNITNVSIPLKDESVFKNCIEKQNHYTGMWNHKHGDHLFYESLGVTRTDDITVIPVLIKKKVFALFYADNYKVNPHHIASSDAEIPHLKKIAEAFALNMLRIMSKK